MEREESLTSRLEVALAECRRFRMQTPEYRCDHEKLALLCKGAHSSKIEAIKSFRGVSGAGLKEAKESVEAVWT